MPTEGPPHHNPSYYNHTFVSLDYENSKSTENLRQIFLRLTTMELHSVWQHQLTTLLRFEPIGKGKEEPTSKLTTHSAEPSFGCGRRRTHVFPSFLPPFSRVQGSEITCPPHENRVPGPVPGHTREKSQQKSPSLVRPSVVSMNRA